MIVRISASTISGKFLVPASKSMMQRACALAWMYEGKTIINNPGKSNDDLVALEIVKSLGAKVRYIDDTILIDSFDCSESSDEINCGESGLSCRMFTPLAALSEKEIRIIGNGSLLKRPMNSFETLFNQVGVRFCSENGMLPFSIKGPIHPTDLLIEASDSSQYLTGILFAFAKSAKKHVCITVQNVKSRPYINLSLQMLNDFGFVVLEETTNQFSISPTEKLLGKKPTLSCTIESDWSSASCIFVAAALAGDLEILGLNQYSLQADRAIVQVLYEAGVQVDFDNGTYHVKKQEHIKPFNFDATDCPDLFPALVILAAKANGISRIVGVNRLFTKESNRALALKSVMQCMGVPVSIENDTMCITGVAIIKGGVVHSFHDHRIVMACSCLALLAESELVIEDAESVNKSFPDFFNTLERLGGSISIIN